MKFCVVQTRPVKGNIQANIENHNRLIALAITKGADIIIFPELSLTGYEPELANDLATNIDDNRFDLFQEISNLNRVIIGVGMPIRSSEGISISMIIFQPGTTRNVYHKKYIHADEEEFFISGENSRVTIGEKNNIALAICYELSVPVHADEASKKKAEFYIASAVKTKDAMQRTMDRLSEIAKKYSMTVLFSNCVGKSGGDDCGGKSSAWNNKGELLGQLNETDEGILLLDTTTNEIIREQLRLSHDHQMRTQGLP
jgi:predicted amidohydrolase